MRATNQHARAVADHDRLASQSGWIGGGGKIVASPTPEIGKAMLRAALMCGPYRLPAQKYEKWKQILVDFDLGPPKQN
jgi:hypothetical protein